MNDDELDRLLRASNPVPAPTREALTLRQQTILDGIVAGTPVRQKPRTRRLALILSAPLAATVAVLTIVAVSLGFFGGSPAAAYGPAPLVYQPIDATLEETVHDITEQLRAEPPGTAERYSHRTAWNLSVDEAGTPEQVVSIQPLIVDRTWAADLSGHDLTIVGEPFDVTGQAVPTNVDPPPGTVLDDREYAPGEFPTSYPGGDLFVIDDFRAEFGVLAPDPALPGGAVNAIAGFLNEWTPTAAQHADMLEALLEYDGLRLLGTTTDRLGREVIGIAAPGAKERESSLLISVDTGRILGVEDTVLSSADPLGVPDGTVISYALWKEPE